MIDNVRVEHILPVEDKLIPPYMDYDVRQETECPECIDFVKHPPITDEIEVILGDYEFVLKDGKTYFVKKKPQYPKTFDECCKVLLGKTSFQDFTLCLTKLSTITKMDNVISPDPPHIKEINALYKLLICRDAYWKIAGDWKPEFRFGKKKYCIMTKDNKVISSTVEETNRILAFPTEEMRDTFYENFNDLIEDCKELL